jgi:Flp pilus assembly protein TadG
VVPASGRPAAGVATAIAESVPEVPANAYVSEAPIEPSAGVSPFVIIVCVVLILLIGIAISATLYLHNQRKPKVAAEKAASIASERTAPDDNYIRALNLGNYPAATPVAIVTLNGETVVAGFVTKDRPDQVMQFYKVRFPISDMATDNAGAHLSATLPNNQRIRIDAEPQGTGTQVKVVRLP